MAALSISNCCFDNGFVRISDWIKCAGDQKGCRRCEIVGEYIPSRKHNHYGNFCLGIKIDYQAEQQKQVL